MRMDSWMSGRWVGGLVALVLACASLALVTGLNISPVQAGDCSAGWVALTYDDGPVPTRTRTVLDALESVNAPGTFFTVGYLVRSYPSTVRDAANRGNAIANHTDQHVALTTLSEIRIVRAVTSADAAIRAAGVAALRLVRPPYGSTNSFVKSVLSDAGYSQILWTVDPQDWRGYSASTIANSVLRNTRDGSVILLHDGNSNYRNTAGATKTIVSTLRSRGYCFGVLDSAGKIVVGDVGVDEWEEIVPSDPDFVPVETSPGLDEWEEVIPSEP
jgi:peptidoglycan/xylan/chitin deacetylase (PgdA/CDA1 family)